MEGSQKGEWEQRRGTQKQQWGKVGVYPRYWGQSKYRMIKRKKWGYSQNVTTEHGAVLGFVASTGMLGTVGGQMKCLQGIGVGEPDLDETDDDGVGMDSEEIEEKDEEDMDVDVLIAHVMIMFEGSCSSAFPRYI
jgi:hypothetical protein